jgi:hypothetical protein
VQVGQYPARLLDISTQGVRLEVRCGVGAGLPSSVTLRFVDSDIAVPVEVVWKRRTSDDAWLCGAAIGDGAAAQWRALLETL